MMVYFKGISEQICFLQTGRRTSELQQTLKKNSHSQCKKVFAYKINSFKWLFL